MVEMAAEVVGLTSQHIISHTEAASTKIRLPALIKIANALHTNVDRLLSDRIQDSNAHLMDVICKLFFRTAIRMKYMSCRKPPMLSGNPYGSVNCSA